MCDFYRVMFATHGLSQHNVNLDAYKLTAKPESFSFLSLSVVTSYLVSKLFHKHMGVFFENKCTLKVSSIVARRLFSYMCFMLGYCTGKHYR